MKERNEGRKKNPRVYTRGKLGETILLHFLVAQYAPVVSNAMEPDAFRLTGDATATWTARITATRPSAASAPSPPPLPRPVPSTTRRS